MRRRLGFTLIELMVTMGIIAVLASILSPGVARVRSEASRAKCENNLRQILVACTVYETDSGGVCPWANWIGAEVAGYRPPGWLYHYPSGTGLLACADDVQAGLLYPSLNSTGVFHCPQDCGPYFGGPTENLSSYLINGAVCGYGRRVPAYRVIAFSSNAILFWEADATGAAWTCGAAYPSHPLTTRHLQGGSVGCFDGHVEWMTFGSFELEEQNLPGRLWCNPGTKTGT